MIRMAADTRHEIPEVFSSEAIRANINGTNYAVNSDCFICACVPMADEDGEIGPTDMIVYFDIIRLRPPVPASWGDPGEAAEGQFKVVAVGYGGTPGPKLTEDDKKRLVDWFESNHEKATEIAIEWMED